VITTHFLLHARPETVLAAQQSLTDWMKAEAHTIEGLVKVLVGVGAAIWVAYYFVKNKSFVALIVALLTAGLLVWGVSNVPWFQHKIDREINPIVNPPGLVSQLRDVGR
jgi:hypothetical protein